MFNLQNTQISEFNDAVEKIRTLKHEPDDKEMYNLYGLYKQSLYGDNKTSKPGLFNMRDRFKWAAWEEHKLMSRNTAQKKYIDLVNSLVIKYGVVNNIKNDISILNYNSPSDNI